MTEQRYLTMQVLAPGGAKDPFDILRDYLGREPSIHTFIDSKTENSLWILDNMFTDWRIKPETEIVR